MDTNNKISIAGHRGLVGAAILRNCTQSMHPMQEGPMLAYEDFPQRPEPRSR